MSDRAEEPGDAVDDAPPARRRRWPRVLLWMLGIIVVALAIAWLTRERIADRVITGQLEKYDLPATYSIDSISPGRQVITNLVIGDPRRPDLTIERLEVELTPRWKIYAPAVSLRVVRPRLYGSYRQGKLSFGVLDKVLFAPSTGPFRLPDWGLALEDGRALIESDYGRIGVKAAGSGKLRDGFSGVLAAAAPQLAGGGCTASGASLFGAISVTGERPRFDGPLRLASLDCPDSAVQARGAALAVDARFDQDLAGGEGAWRLETGALRASDVRFAVGSGSGRAAFRRGVLTADYDLAGRQAAYADSLRLREVAASGRVRGRDGLARLEIEGDLSASGVAATGGFDAALAGFERSAQGTLGAPVVAQLRTALRRELSNAAVAGDYTVRREGGRLAVVVPRATVRGTSGQSLIAVSRLQFAQAGAAAPVLSGHVATGGPGMPRIEGEFARQGRGGTTARLSMAEYRAGSSRIALPDLRLEQGSSGLLRFSGRTTVSGMIPGGFVEGLELPLAGSWSPRAGLSGWPGCTAVRFQRLQLGSAEFLRQGVTACAAPGGALLRGGRLAGTASGVELTGRVGTSPLRIRTGPVRMALPGTLQARAIAVELGARDKPSLFRIADLTARTSGGLGGTLSGAEARLAAVPLDVLDASGQWRFADGVITLDQARFRVEDRAIDDRFQPVIARDAVLRVDGNYLSAAAMLREPASDRAVVQVDLAHDLGPGVGHADLAVAGIAFDRQLQPDTLTRLALGVIANARGTVTGTGRIDWNPAGVTSTGRFATDGLDFAAAFGPVKGTRGTVEFKDLLGLVTAPNQTLHIDSISPGIEVENGDVTFELHPDSVLLVKGAKWPFMDGTLELLPVRMVLGAAEVRRYELLVEGADAAKFIQKLELANLSATGIFDGKIPLVFDEEGGQIVDGHLQSRPPGGNLSYVGQLTYEDLSPMANFAFQTLKSLDFRSMRIGMAGSLEGEIITRVTFDGVSQGAGAKSNIITRQIAKLPIRFNVNIRAPFFQLLHSFRGLYDPGAVADPRALGLIDKDGNPIPRQPAPVSVQPAESGNVP